MLTEESPKEVWSKLSRGGKKELRRKEADERQAEHDNLSILDRIAKLDSKLGPNVGAKKERAKLKGALEAQEKKKEEEAKQKLEEKKEKTVAKEAKPEKKKQPEKRSSRKSRAKKEKR
jgi:hypothetical protein